MMTAHLPSGYIPARSLPDTDLIWCHFVDGRAIHHHRCWLHIPAFWAALALIALPLATRTGHLTSALTFFGAILMHLVLDTIADGGIAWAAPLDGRLTHLVDMPAVQPHWMLNFILHWTFLLEFAIWAWAALIFARRRA